MHEAPPELLDCRYGSVVNDPRTRIRDCQAVSCILRTDPALSIRCSGGLEKNYRDRVCTAEESAVANRLRIMLSRQLQSMGIPTNRRASLRDKRAGVGRGLWFSRGRT